MKDGNEYVIKTGYSNNYSLKFYQQTYTQIRAQTRTHINIFFPYQFRLSNFLYQKSIVFSYNFIYLTVPSYYDHLRGNTSLHVDIILAETIPNILISMSLIF